MATVAPDISQAIFQIVGYFSPSPTKSGGYEVEFERARAELLVHRRRNLDLIESTIFTNDGIKCQKSTNRYDTQNAIEAISGYVNFKGPTRKINTENDFNESKRICIDGSFANIADIKAITFEQFMDPEINSEIKPYLVN